MDEPKDFKTIKDNKKKIPQCEPNHNLTICGLSKGWASF